MKRQIFITMVCLMATVMQAQNDSIKNETLPEVVVNADGQIEMAELYCYRRCWRRNIRPTASTC